MDTKFIVPVLLLAVALVAGCTSTTGQTSGTQSSGSGEVKEFYMDSFVVFEDGKPKPQFSVKEITVNKGDRVVLHINVTSGMHDFKLDEFGVYSDTPSGEATTIEFIADKAGEFVYYCNMPGHRANGHWGTLKVLG